MTLAFLAMGLAGFGWGTLSDRIGPRLVVLAGILLLGLASILASRASSQAVGRIPRPFCTISCDLTVKGVRRRCVG